VPAMARVWPTRWPGCCRQPEPLAGLSDLLDHGRCARSRISILRGRVGSRVGRWTSWARLPALRGAVLAVADASGERGLAIGCD